MTTAYPDAEKSMYVKGKKMIPGTAVCTEESTAQHGTAPHRGAGQGTARHGTARPGAAKLAGLVELGVHFCDLAV